MIHLTRLDGTPIVINADLITMIESIPDSVVCLSTGSRIIVRESAATIVELALDYRRTLLAPLPGSPNARPPAPPKRDED